MSSYKSKKDGKDQETIQSSTTLDPVTVDNYGSLFNLTTVGQASDSMMALTKSFNRLVGA